MRSAGRSHRSGRVHVNGTIQTQLDINISLAHNSPVLMRDAVKFTAVLNAMLLMLLLLRERSCSFYVFFFKFFLCVQNI